MKRRDFVKSVVALPTFGLSILEPPTSIKTKEIVIKDTRVFLKNNFLNNCIFSNCVLIHTVGIEPTILTNTYSNHLIRMHTFKNCHIYVESCTFFHCYFYDSNI